ncbi:MAG: zinc ribbon domain-containing protein [Methanoregula sp.]|nr:zinc ribbon domain-containing protein [Methanoregula sp.]
MGKPASHQEFRHTCPVCNTPVRPGYKFCEICGTRIPSLATCSKCGTQFIHPKKFCDLCGAPFILEEIPEPDTEEIPEPDTEEIPEPDVEEIPEPDTDEVPEPDVEEIPEPVEEETPGHYEDKIPEPDTDELLEQFGGDTGMIKLWKPTISKNPRLHYTMRKKNRSWFLHHKDGDHQRPLMTRCFSLITGRDRQNLR